MAHTSSDAFTMTCLGSQWRELSCCIKRCFWRNNESNHDEYWDECSTLLHMSKQQRSIPHTCSKYSIWTTCHGGWLSCCTRGWCVYGAWKQQHVQTYTRKNWWSAVLWYILTTTCNVRQTLVAVNCSPLVSLEPNQTRCSSVRVVQNLAGFKVQVISLRVLSTTEAWAMTVSEVPCSQQRKASLGTQLL